MLHLSSIDLDMVRWRSPEGHARRRERAVARGFIGGVDLMTPVEASLEASVLSLERQLETVHTSLGEFKRENAVLREQLTLHPPTPPLPAQPPAVTEFFVVSQVDSEDEFTNQFTDFEFAVVFACG